MLYVEKVLVKMLGGQLVKNKRRAEKT